MAQRLRALSLDHLTAVTGVGSFFEQRNDKGHRKPGKWHSNFIKLIVPRRYLNTYVAVLIVLRFGVEFLYCFVPISVFVSGNFFLIAQFPDQCLPLPFFTCIFLPHLLFSVDIYQ